MDVIEITRFKFDGKEYDSPAKVKTEVENRIGKFIDESDPTLTPKQRLNILAMMEKNKIAIANLLTVSYEFHSSTGYQTRNILDF